MPLSLFLSLCLSLSVSVSLSVAPCNARAKSCASDVDCPRGYVCGDCGPLGLYTDAGFMCRPGFCGYGTNPSPSTANSTNVTCVQCQNGGIDYDCGTGYRTGEYCDGTDPGVDTQTCADCPPNNYTCTAGQYKDLNRYDEVCVSGNGRAFGDPEACVLCLVNGNDPSNSPTWENFSCPRLEYKGRTCNGTTSSDVQSCIPCNNVDLESQEYSCPGGDGLKTGTECDGTTYSDTQTCKLACSECSDGEYRLDGSCDSCLPCEAGYFCQRSTKFKCGLFAVCPPQSTKPTPVGEANYSYGGDSEVTHTNQAPCPSGEYCLGAKRFNCSAGTWSSGQESSPACTACPAGSYGAEGDKNTNDTCSGPCAAGYWCGPVGTYLSLLSPLSFILSLSLRPGPPRKCTQPRATAS